MKLSIVLSAQPASFSALAYKGELAANVSRISDLGYDGVELAVRDPELLELEKLQKVLSENKLDVPAIGTGQAYGEDGLSFTDPDAKIREQAIRRIKTQVDFASSLNAQVILGLIRGKAAEELSREQAWQWLLQALRECAEYALQKNIKLAMEPINRYETNLVNTIAEGLNLLEKVGAENFGLLLDTFHMNIEEPSVEKSIRMAGERIFHFHLADSNRWYPGAGHIDFRRLIEVLRDTGYEGYLSAEILPLPDADTCAERTLKTMRPILRDGDKDDK